MVIPLLICERCIVIITGPDRTGIIWSVTCKPEINVVGCCTGLTGSCHIGKTGRSTGSFCQNAFHCACQKICGGFFQDSTLFLCLSTVEQDIAVMIQNLGVHDRLLVNTAVCDCGVCRTHFVVIHTVCDTAKGKRLVNICKYLTLICSPAFNQSGESKVLTVGKAKLRRNLCQCLDSADIGGLLNRLPHGHITAVIIAPPVGYRSTIRVFIRFILDDCCQCFTGAVKGRSVGRQNLKAGTRLSCRSGVCTVQTHAGGLGSTAADHGLDLSGSLINDGH